MTQYFLQLTGETDGPIVLDQTHMDLLLATGRQNEGEYIPSETGRVFATVTTDPADAAVTYEGKEIPEDEVSRLLSAALQHLLQQALTS